QGIQSGADDFITKPIDSVELLARVQGIMRLNRYRNLLNERHRFEWVLDQADDGYVVLDQDDRIIFTNPAAQRYFENNHDGASLDGAKFMEVVQKHYRVEPVSAWEQWHSRPYQGGEVLYLIQPQQASSPAIWLQVGILEQMIGQQSQRLVRVQDVSAQMETQQAMWAFQSTVRHKLNTPLHGLASCMELLTIQSVEDTDPDELHEIIGWAQEAMQRLEASVTSVLRHAQAPELLQGDAQFPLRELPELVGEIAAAFELRHKIVSGMEPEAAGVPVGQINYDPLGEGVLLISRPALESIFTELFENAKKFHPGHVPTVTVAVQRTTSLAGVEAVHISVMDDGITLSPIQLEKMWIPYYQGEQKFTGEVPGMGLGLSLVRSLLWQVGGTCSANNRVDGSGITVDMVLPLL
ncbi:MAG: PAS domain-containing protein, partial [Caldilineaceae bacterium]|nr:PAS domain-containing protein [Caldilineaceae bacterium]